MRHAVQVLLLLGSCLALHAGPDPAEDAWTALLAAGELTPATAQLASQRWTGGGAHRLADFERLWGDWREVTPHARARAAALEQSGDSLVALLAAGATPLGVELPSAEPAPVGTDLVAALAALHALRGAPLDPEQRERLRAASAAVPPSVATAAATVLIAVPAAVAARDAALSGLDPEQAFTSALRLARSYKAEDGERALLERLDLPTLLRGARGLCAATDRALALLRAETAPLGSFSFSWDTPLGRVTLHGEGSQSIGTEPMLLAIDSAGDDEYAAGSGPTDAAHPVSVLIDLAGDDRHQSAALGDFGAGLLGYGLHVDVAGDDRYGGLGLAQGSGAAGVGLLLDLAGDDRYQLDEHGQGAATLGVGLLADLAGDDQYLCLQQAQGYGGVRGAGTLWDAAGDDRYEADDQDIRRPSPQTQEHNTSLAQGCAFGRRAHPGDGHSLAGGEGLLCDGQGDDRYRCGVFGQGVAYWYGTGLLVDLAGDDDYGGVWYVQGAAAHYAVGGLLDLAGDDRYALSHTQGQGHGHDYSIGVLCDARGDDRYQGASHTLGAALWNGIGVLEDGAGADVYRHKGASLGHAGDSRPEHRTLGLFLDRGGDARFPPGDAAPRSAPTWRRPGPNPRAIGLGAAR